MSFAQRAWLRSFSWLFFDRILAWQPFAKSVRARVMSTLSHVRCRSLSFSSFDKLSTRDLSCVWFSLLTLHPLITRVEATNMSFSWKACRRRHTCSSFERMLTLQPLLTRVWTTNMSLAQQGWWRSFFWLFLDRILALQPFVKSIWARVMSTSSQARWRSLSFSFLGKLCTRNWSWVWFSLLTLHPLLTRAVATNMSSLQNIL